MTLEIYQCKECKNIMQTYSDGMTALKECDECGSKNIHLKVSIGF